MKKRILLYKVVQPWETRHAMELCAAQNLIDALAGRRPRYLVNPRP